LPVNQHGGIMTDPEFMDQAEALLKLIESQCDVINDSTDADIDIQRNGAMLTLTFSNTSQIIVNMQKPLHEIWMATKSGGFHYRWNSGHWIDTKKQTDFLQELSDNASAQAGLELRFGS
jgi:CyaY protein